MDHWGNLRLHSDVLGKTAKHNLSFEVKFVLTPKRWAPQVFVKKRILAVTGVEPRIFLSYEATLLTICQFLGLRRAPMVF